MRFKSIFWLFNIVVFTALIIFALASFLLFGKEYAAVYWGNMWIVAVLFILLITALDTYFIRNWSLFDYLEKEDWPSLLAWLEDKIYARKQLRKPYANLLINTALSVSNYDAVKKLDAEVRERKPEMLRHIGVSLGIPYLKDRDWTAMAAHYSPLADDPGTRHLDWARWCRGMAEGEEGLEEITELLESRNISIRILAVQSLDNARDRLSDAQLLVLKSAKTALQGEFSSSSDSKALQRSRDEHLMAVVLSGAVDEAVRDILAEKV